MKPSILLLALGLPSLAYADDLPFATACSTNWLVPGTPGNDVRQAEVPLHRYRERMLLGYGRSAVGASGPSQYACFLWKDLRARTLIARFVTQSSPPGSDYFSRLYADMAADDDPATHANESFCENECDRIRTNLDLGIDQPETWCRALCADGDMPEDQVCGSLEAALRPSEVLACDASPPPP